MEGARDRMDRGVTDEHRFPLEFRNTCATLLDLHQWRIITRLARISVIEHFEKLMDLLYFREHQLRFTHQIYDTGDDED